MNLHKMMKQAQQMQAKVQAAQAQLEQEEEEGSSGGGAVVVRLNGKYEMRKITLDKSVVNADDAEMLEDLILAAYNDARKKVDALTKSKLDEATGGMKLPF